MPYSFDLLDEQMAKNKGQGQDQPDDAAPQMTGGGQTFSGSGGSGSATPSPQPSNTPQGTATQGSGFVNLDKYVKANQGNNFGDQFTGKVQSDVNQAKDTLQKSSQDFTNASNHGTTNWGDVGDTATGIVNNAGDNTTADDASKIQGWENAQYQGPQSFTGSAYGTAAQGAAQKATQETGALQNEGGRFALLDQFYGRPNYSTGEKSLDNLLAQQGTGVAARQAALGNQGQQLQGNINQSTQGLDNLATANQAASQETAQKTKDLVSGALTGFDTDLDNRFKAYNDANTTYNQGLQSDISDDQLNPDTLAAYGLKSGDSLYNVNLGNYLNPTTTQANLNQFASDQDYAKYLALNQIAGDDPTELLASDRSLAGTGAGMGRDTVNTDQLQKDIASAQSAYTTQNGAIGSQINSLQQQIPDLQNKINAFNSDSGQPKGSTVHNLQDGNNDNPNAAGAKAALQSQIDAINQQIAQYQAQQTALASQYGVGRKVS